MSHELTKRAEERAREEFQRALDAALPNYDLWQLKLLNESEEEWVRNEVERMLYEPKLANGGDFERRVVEKLKKLSRQKDWDGWARAQGAMRAWRNVLPDNPRCPGYYYQRTPLKRAANKEEYEWLQALKHSAHVHKQWDKKWFAQLLLDGAPEPAADFLVECFYLLKCADGDVSRQVQLTNVLGETTGKVLMDSKAFHAPKDFREWCLKRGGFNWGAGEKELQKLHLDIGRLAAWKTVHQVVTLGWFPLSKKSSPTKTELNGIWFFGDCAWMSGKWETPDEDGIYWHRHADEAGNVLENGYQVSSDGRENPFHQKKPLLHPHARLIEQALELEPMPEINFTGQKPPAKGGLVPALSLNPAEEREREEMLCRAFFREMCQRLTRIVGSDDALFLIGSFLSFAAAPELFEELSQFPGLWTHGEANSGKSTILRWLMEIWGFRVLGINLKGTNSTAVGLLQAADQYSNLPVLLDEFRDDKEQVGKDKLGVLHNGFDRGGQAKFNPSGIQRSMRTTFIISGESTTTESAIRGRYPHVQISKHLRQWAPDEEERAAIDGRTLPIEDFLWITKHRHFFFFFGRYIIERREQFVAATFKFFELWGHENIDPRLQVVHGVGYASWMAMVELLGSHSGEEVEAFKRHMLDNSKRATEDVQSDLNVNVFIQDLITAWNAREIPAQCFRVESQYLEHAPDEPNQLNWESYTLYIHPENAIAALQIWLRKQNASIVLKRKDLRDQLSKNDFWVKPEGGDGICRKRFSRVEGRMATCVAWGIKVDKHPLGYQRQSDEVMKVASTTLAKQGDPRKGPLFMLIEGVLAAQKESSEPE